MHKCVLTISSEGNDPGVHVELEWSPDLDKFDPRELGYTPAAFQFLERHILPILERAMLMSEYGELVDAEPASERIN